MVKQSIILCIKVKTCCMWKKHRLIHVLGKKEFGFAIFFQNSGKGEFRP